MKRDHIRFIFLYLITTIFLIACGISGLFNGEGVIPREELEGVVWRLEAMGEQGNPRTAVEGRDVTLQFDFVERRVHGHGGCNAYSADFKIDGHDLTVGLAMSTLMACFPEDVMSQETAFHQILPLTERYEIEGGRLTITTSHHQVLVFSQE